MKRDKKRPGGRGSRILLQELLLFLCAAAIGIGWAVFRSDQYLPTLEGNVYAMDPTGNTLFMVLSKEANNSLVQIDYNGTLLHYAVTETDQAFENLVVLDNTIYAVLTTYAANGVTQKLVALSMEHAAMPMEILLDLAKLPAENAADITWTGAYLPLEESPAEICLGGVDSRGNSFLLHWDLAAGQARLEPILPGETVYKLKYVDTGHYVWIDSQGRLGQYIQGEWQRDLLAGGQNSTPLHISTCQERVFVSDSQSGDIAELKPDGTVSVRWRGGEAIRQSGYQYQDIAIFTTREEQPGQIQVIGLCTAPGGDSNVVVGPNGVIGELKMGNHLARLVLLHSWRLILLGFAALTGIAALVRMALHSARTAVRLAVCELIMAGVMLGSILGIQYRFYQTTVQEDARQKLQLLGGNLADVLAAADPSEDGQAGRLVDEVMQRAPDSGQYSVNVVWAGETGTPVIGYDRQVPEGYAMEDVKSRSYYTAVSNFLYGRQQTALLEIRNALNVKEFVYIQRIAPAQPDARQGEGCVTVLQSESDVLAGRAGFWLRMAPALVAFPFLFALLILVTWRLLYPLGIVRRALEEFYDTGGGNQMDLSRMPRTELYEMGMAFNELSRQTKVQFNTLAHINGAYTRLVPDCLYRMLHREDVLALQAGAYATVSGGLLILVPYTPARTAQALEALFRPAAEWIAKRNGMVVDYDEGLGAMTALFGDGAQAESCARQTLASYDAAREKVMAALIRDSVEFGVFGSERLLYPVAVSGSLHRRQEVLSLMLEFGAALVLSGVPDNPSLRLLGWDGPVDYYEDPACRPGGWLAQWQQAAGLWNEAIGLFRQQRFAAAMRRFARVLRLMPQDAAARWYLFRCEVLRDADPGVPQDTGLLYNWRDRHG